MKRYFFTFSIVVLLLSLLCGCGAPLSDDEAPPSGAQAMDSTREEAPPAEEQDPIAAQIAAMTVEEKVGQLFFVRCPEENAAEDVAQYHLGGMILFGRDFKGKTYAQVRALTEELQQSADIPLLIGADEEGGTVVRASVNPHLRADKFPAPQALSGVCPLCAAMRRKSRPSCWGWASTSTLPRCATFPPTPGIISIPARWARRRRRRRNMCPLWWKK